MQWQLRAGCVCRRSIYVHSTHIIWLYVSTLYVWLVTGADLFREKRYCWLAVVGWFVLREKVLLAS
jgi:hypothetical protein